MDALTIISVKQGTPKHRHPSSTGLLAQLPLPSDAILAPVEVLVERQGLSGQRWAWRLVRDSRTLLASKRQYSGAEEAYDAGVRVAKGRRGSG